MMQLPARFDYEEFSDTDPDGETYWYPEVRCTVLGCQWVYQAVWSDLASDGDVDWDAEHPNHQPQSATHTPGAAMTRRSLFDATPPPILHWVNTGPEFGADMPNGSCNAYVRADDYEGVCGYPRRADGTCLNGHPAQPDTQEQP